MGLLTGCAFPPLLLLASLHGQSEAPQSKELIKCWSGEDGLVDRFLAFRTSNFTEWESLTRPMFDSARTFPSIDFHQFEVVGVVLPHKDARPPIQFATRYEELDDKLVLQLECENAPEAGKRDPGSQFAFALVPHTEKRIIVRSSSADLKSDLATSEGTELTALVHDKPDQLPPIPLHLGGANSCGSLPTEHVEVFIGGKAVCQAGEKRFRVAHVMVQAPSASSANGTMSTGDSLFSGFGALREYFFQIGQRKVRVRIEINERDRTLTVKDKTFFLDKGNFIHVAIDSNGDQRVTQLPVVKTQEPADGETCESARQTFLNEIRTSRRGGKEH